MRGKPSMSVSTGVFPVGLAHFIHEIYNPIQLVDFAACLMDMRGAFFRFSCSWHMFL